MSFASRHPVLLDSVAAYGRHVCVRRIDQLAQSSRIIAIPESRPNDTYDAIVLSKGQRCIGLDEVNVGDRVLLQPNDGDLFARLNGDEEVFLLDRHVICKVEND
jgi:co-chaperonin GroES (HSP10)